VWSCTGEGPLTVEQIAELRSRLRRMSLAELQKFYEAALEMCRISRGAAPRPTYVQQLVQAWRELRRRGSRS
jgi:hypothetical protein